MRPKKGRSRGRVGRRAVLALVIAVIVVAAVAAAFVLSGQSPAYSSAAKKATDYLVTNYNASIGMIPETPGGHTYFVYSDNFLASYVLSKSPNQAVRAIAANITSTMNRYLAKVGHLENQYEVIASTNGTFFTSSNYVLARSGDSTIETTQNNGTSTLSPKDYADIACLETLYFHQTFSSDAAQEFRLAANLSDGRGFADKAFTDPSSSSYNVYQTYKLAVCDFAAKIIGVSPPRGVEANLARMQAPSGGFYTGYTADFSPNGTTNTETTSLAVMALGWQGGKIVLPDVSYSQPFLLMTAAPVATVTGSAPRTAIVGGRSRGGHMALGYFLGF